MKIDAEEKTQNHSVQTLLVPKGFSSPGYSTAWYTAELGSAWPSCDIAPATSQWLK